MIEEQELQSIEKRANKASNAPWTVEADNYSGANWLIGAVSVFLGGSSWDDKSYYVTTQGVHASELVGDAKTDAEFIARAREDVPALVAEVRRLRAQWAQVVAIADESARGDTNISAYNMSRVRDLVRDSQAVTA